MIDKFFKIGLLLRTIENLHTAVLDRLGFIQGEIVYKVRQNNLRFFSRAGTEDLAEIVVVASGYEYNSKLIDLPDNPVILDLGAYIGTFSIFIARKLHDKCRIYAYEPDEKNYKLLKRNISLNKIRSVLVQNIAISDYTGRGFLENKRMNTDAYFLDEKNNRTFNCSVSTLGKLSKEAKIGKIDLLKMDIEGGEYKVLLHKQTLNFIKNNVRYIFMEYHNIDSLNNYSRIKNIIESNFNVLNRHGVTITLENKHSENI